MTLKLVCAYLNVIHIVTVNCVNKIPWLQSQILSTIRFRPMNIVLCCCFLEDVLSGERFGSHAIYKHSHEQYHNSSGVQNSEGGGRDELKRCELVYPWE